MSKSRTQYVGLWSLGNSKLPETTAIFNITSAKDCPSNKLGLCAAVIDGKNKCYARQAEYSYPGVLPYRQRQAALWANTTATEYVKLFLSAIGKRKIYALRLNESGDYRSQADVHKAETIARLLSKRNIIVYGYTSRPDLNFSKLKYLRLIGSGFKKPGIRGIFKIIKDKSEKPRGCGICPSDCSICNRCLQGKNTCVLLHGTGFYKR
jgi:hypothetical protein